MLSFYVVLRTIRSYESIATFVEACDMRMVGSSKPYVILMSC